MEKPLVIWCSTGTREGGEVFCSSLPSRACVCESVCVCTRARALGIGTCVGRNRLRISSSGNINLSSSLTSACGLVVVQRQEKSSSFVGACVLSGHVQASDGCNASRWSLRRRFINTCVCASNWILCSTFVKPFR